MLGRHEPGTLTAMMGADLARCYPQLTFADLFDGYGNDEIVFDFAKVPSLSVQMFPCEEYHSSLDAPDRLDQANIDFAAEAMFRICRIVERDGRYRLGQQVPIYMTRFDLYADEIRHRQDFVVNRQIMYGLRDERSLLEIADGLNVDFFYVAYFVRRLAEHGLVTRLV